MNRFNRNLTQLALALAAVTSASMASAAGPDFSGLTVSASQLDLGTTVGPWANLGTSTPSGTQAAVRFDLPNGGGSIFQVIPSGNATPLFYTKNSANQLELHPNQAAASALVAGPNVSIGSAGPTANTTQQQRQSNVVKQADAQNVKYSETVQTRNSVTVKGGLFTPDKTLADDLDQTLATTAPVTVFDRSVATGIINNDANGNGIIEGAGDNIYGLKASNIVTAPASGSTAASTTTNTATLIGDSLTVSSQVGTAPAAVTTVSAAGVTATGDLTIGGNTNVQALNAGATGVSTLNASGLVTAGNGLNVTGDTSVQKLTAGDTSVQKLTAGDTSVQKLTAGDTSVQKLTAGATGVTTLTASDLVTAGKGLNVTGDTSVQKLTAGDTSVQKLTAGKVTTSNIDLGSSTNSVIVPTAASNNRLTARYDTTDTAGKAVTIYETQSSGVSTYYTISAGVATEFKNATVIGTLGKTVAPTAGGTTTAQSTLNTTTAAVKEVTSQATTYGETKTQQDAVTVNGTLNNGEAVSVNVGTGASVELNNQSVVTGIIGTNGGNNVYGTVATAKDTNAQGVLTSNKTAALTAGGVTVKDTVAGTSSSLTASGLTTAAITLAGKDLGGEISRIDLAATAETKARTDADVALKTSVDKEVDDRTAADALIRTDFTTADTAIRNAATAETTRVNSEVNRLDGRVTSLASTVDSNFRYLDGRVNQVERTANRGVAISLAAQQSVPNLSAGRTAIYGGVGHYEGESALAFGVATMLKDNRTAFSLAIGASGSKEIGGRAGVSFVFGE